MESWRRCGGIKSDFRYLIVTLLAGGQAFPQTGDAVRLTIKDHRFSPAEVSVPAGQRFRIEVSNQDATAAEFESSELKIEKVVAGGATISVMAGPLKPGAYKFFDEYIPTRRRARSRPCNGSSDARQPAHRFS